MGTERAYRKVDEIDMVLWTGALLILWGGTAILDAFGIGLVLSPLVEAAAVFSMDQWFKGRGGKTTGRLGTQFLKYFLNLLPFLPVPLATFWFMTLNHNHARATAAAAKIGGTAIGAVVGGPVGARIGRAAGGLLTDESMVQAAGAAATGGSKPKLPTHSYRQAA